MKKEKPRKKLVWVILAGIFGLAFIGLLIFAIYDDIASEKSIVRLGDYSNLSYTATDRDTAGTQVLESIVEKTRFGALVEQAGEEYAKAAMNVYEENAKYLGISLEEYLKLYFGSEVENFRKNVRRTSLLVAKEEAVTDFIADKENIQLSEEKYEDLLTRYMDSTGYTDREQFLIDYDEKVLRVQMRREITVDYLLERAKGPALTD